MLAQNREQSAQIVGILGTISAVVAVYLIKEHYSTGPSVCDSLGGSRAFSCSTVNQSVYSELLGVPVAVFGAIWSGVIAYGAWRIYLNDRVAYFTTALLLWSSLGLGFIVYMVYGEYQLGAICIFCTLVHIITLVIFYLVLQLYLDMSARPSAGTFLYSMRNVIIIVFLVCIIPVFLFNMRGPAPPLLVKTGGSTGASSDESASKGGSDPWTDLAKCLTSKNIKMFGSDSCGACRNQKALFGDAFKHVDYTDCGSKSSQNQKACEDNKIDRYPTWIQFSVEGVEESRKTGVLSSPDLQTFSTCKVTE